MSISINNMAKHTMSSEALHNLVQLQGRCPGSLAISIEYQNGHYLVTVNAADKPGFNTSYYSRSTGFEIVDMLEPLIDLARGGQ